jgi:hypothetical protein
MSVCVVICYIHTGTLEAVPCEALTDAAAAAEQIQKFHYYFIF